MTTIRLTVEYEGTGYAGWQVQPNEKTIQGELEDAIAKVTGQNVSVIGAGRTDSGVHALRQVASFRIDHTLPALQYRSALNHYLLADIRVRESVEAPDGFDARRWAKSKRYRYLIGREKSAIHRRFRWEHAHDVDLDRLKKAAAEIVGTHDFAPFCVVASLKENNKCTIYSARWRRIGPLLLFEIRGNRFLHNMVRILVGSMINLAQLRQDNNRLNLTLDSFADIIRNSRPERVPFTAPAHGLYLVSVEYAQGNDE
ncbi:MAG: tRNA pseudouridine(38-40) synthase TruA [Candidatus Zixiibacteriota bacterium]